MQIEDTNEIQAKQRKEAIIQHLAMARALLSLCSDQAWPYPAHESKKRFDDLIYSLSNGFYAHFSPRN